MTVARRPGRDERDARGADEPRLVDEVRAGSSVAFDVLVRRYQEPAFAVAVSILQQGQDAEDAVQDAFIRALDRIEQLRPGSRFGPWFYQVLRSTCLNLRRREKLRSHGEIPEGAAGGGDPASEFEANARRARILKALEQLPERQRIAVTLFDLEGYDHAEIAEILEIAVGTSRANLHHGRQALKRALESSERTDKEARNESS